MSKTNFEFLDALGQIARDKGISVETLLDALANALVAAYKRRPDAAEEAVVTIDPESGEIRVYGQELDEDGNVINEWDDTPDDFGRIAAQTAKQVILQRIREVERDMKYEEYAGREGDIVTGIVQQTDNRYTLLDLGKVEALLPQAEQVSYERYEHGARLKAYIVEVRKTTKGPQIVVSRTHPGLIKRLFELEVPEISSGVVEIKAAAREPGHRTKIAVWSNDPNVDPVGACVGARGSRVRMVTNELRGRAGRRGAVLRRPGRADPERPGPGPGPRGPPRRRDRHGHRGGERLPALAGHRQGGPERPAGGPPHRLADRHQERDPAGRGGGRLRRQEWAEGEWVENEAGEMVWKPAEGGEAISAEEWTHQAEEQAEAAPRRPPTAAPSPATPRRPRPPRRRRRRGGGDAHRPRPAAEASRRRGGRHSARRTCVGCRRRAPADELVRVVRRPDGTLVDRARPGPRRLALCRDSPACLDAGGAPAGLRAGAGAPVGARAAVEQRSQAGLRRARREQRRQPDVRG